jgi:hypothetical protein
LRDSRILWAAARPSAAARAGYSVAISYPQVRDDRYNRLS